VYGDEISRPTFVAVARSEVIRSNGLSSYFSEQIFRLSDSGRRNDDNAILHSGPSHLSSSVPVIARVDTILVWLNPCPSPPPPLENLLLSERIDRVQVPHGIGIL
jgi:hypothetical protein